MKRVIRGITVGILTVGLLINVALAASVFPDVDAYSEYAEAVEYVYEAGIMLGDNTGCFNPNSTITRAEMATIICRMLGETENLTVSPVFSDVPTSHWANPYVAKAAELGIVYGYDNGKFGPTDPLTYEQAVTMIIRALGGEELAQGAGGYPDGFLALAKTHGFLTGVVLEKGEQISRGEIANILYNCDSFRFEINIGNLQDGAQTD